MIATLLNPPRRKRRKGRGRRKLSRATRSARARRAASRRRGRAYRKSTSALLRKTLCGMTHMKLRKIQRSCRMPFKKVPLFSFSGAGGRSLSGKVAANGRRRRRRNRRVGFNYRPKRRNKSTYFPAMSMNPSGIVRSATMAFDRRTITNTLPLLGGFLFNRYLTATIAGLLPNALSFMKSGLGAQGLGLISASLMSAGLKMVAPRYAGDALKGGVIQVVTSVAQQYVLPMIGFSPMAGMGDYLTVGDAARARPLMGLGDYLTVGDAARARPLSGLGYTGDLYGQGTDAVELGGGSGKDAVAAMPMVPATANAIIEEQINDVVGDAIFSCE